MAAARFAAVSLFATFDVAAFNDVLGSVAAFAVWHLVFLVGTLGSTKLTGGYRWGNTLDFFSLEINDQVHVFRADDEKARMMFTAEHGKALAEAVLAHVGGEFEAAQQLMCNYYCGAHPSEEAFALCQEREKYFFLKADNLVHAFWKVA